MKNIFKNFIVSLFSILSICFIGVALTGCKDENKETFAITATVEQVENNQLINISWASEKEIDEITITLKHNDVVEKTVTVDMNGQSYNEILKEGNIFIDTYYGRHTVDIVAKSGEMTSEKQTKTVDVYTDVYNIANLVATVPVSVYTLGMKNYTNNYEIPTFFWLQRSNAWDYSELPYNVYPIPTASAEEITTEYSNTRNEKTIAWIKELYEINNESKFNIFCNDYWSQFWIDASYENDIPVENFSITLISDGVGSYSMFNEIYNNENAEETYNTYAQLWDNYKSGNVSSLTTNQCRALTYVWVQDPEIDVTWVINRIDTIGQANDAVKNKITELYNNNTGRIRRYYLDKLWNELSDEEKSQLKKLYHIGDAFIDAENAGKTPMVILGTDTPIEGDDLADYINLLKKYYGDSYVYYYKGHPAYPTNANPEKQALLKSLNVIELESSIPAEFFYYFYPTISYSGYSSSTFINVGDIPSKSVFTSYESCQDSHREYLEVFMSKLDPSDEIYGDLVKHEQTDLYLIQEKSHLNSSSDFTKVKVYNASKQTFTIYTLMNGSYIIAE